MDAGVLITCLRSTSNKNRNGTVCLMDSISLPYAQTFEHSITISIPEGFAVEGLEKLYSNIETEKGYFKSTAYIKERKLFIHAIKAYNCNTAQAADWPKFLAFIDAAFEFSQQKIVFTRKPA